MTPLLFALLALNLVTFVAVVVLYRRAKKAQRRRVVERPNSEFKSAYVLDLEAKDRWERLDLSRLHEVNREEAERVLAKLRTASTRGLSATERAYLDRLVEAERRVEKTTRREHRRVRETGSAPRSEGTPRPAAG